MEEMIINQYLPEEIIDIIIPNFPASSLSRFKSVSKSWNSLITNPNFQHKEQKYNCILALEESESLKASIYSIQNSRAVRESPPYIISNSVKLSSANSTLLSNFCDGIVVIRYNGKFHKLNPVTGPSSRIHNSSLKRKCVSIGLCHDKIIVWHKQESSSLNKPSLRKRVPPLLARFCSLEGGQWSQIPLPFNIVSVNTGVLMNNKMHWIVEQQMPYSYIEKKSLVSRPKRILCYNSCKNSFKKFPSPTGHHSPILCLGVLGESLCMARWIDEKIEVLVMKEYGVRESWTNLFFLSSDCRPFLFTPNCEILMKRKPSSEFSLLKSSNDRNASKHRRISVRKDLPELLAYNLNTKKIADLGILSTTNWSGAVSFFYNF